MKLNVLPRSPIKRKLLLSGGIAALLLTAEYHGCVSGAYRWLKRYKYIPQSIISCLIYLKHFSVSHQQLTVRKQMPPSLAFAAASKLCLSHLRSVKATGLAPFASVSVAHAPAGSTLCRDWPRNCSRSRLASNFNVV